MTKKQQLSELKRMVNRTITKFEGNDSVTKQVNLLLSQSYVHLSIAYNIAHGWNVKRK